MYSDWVREISYAPRELGFKIIFFNLDVNNAPYLHILHH